MTHGHVTHEKIGFPKDPKEGTAYVLVRIRGTVNVNGKVQDTMRMLRIAAPNHCAIVPANDSSLGMIEKCKDYIAFGEVDLDTTKELLRARGRTTGNAPLTDDVVSKASEGRFATMDAFAAALAKGEVTLKDLGETVKPLFRLAPPRGGHDRIKRHVAAGGPLGYHGKEINVLVRRML